MAATHISRLSYSFIYVNPNNKPQKTPLSLSLCSPKPSLKPRLSLTNPLPYHRPPTILTEPLSLFHLKTPYLNSSPQTNATQMDVLMMMMTISPVKNAALLASTATLKPHTSATWPCTRCSIVGKKVQVLAYKLPELLDFSKDLNSLERASKIQLKFLAEEMQAVNKGLEKVVQELSMSENDGPISENFRKVLKAFLRFAEGEVRALASLYSGVGRNVDALILYFGEDPARCPFEQVISTLLNFVRMFNRAHEENCKQLELEMKKSAESEKSKINASHKESLHTPIKSSNVK